MYVIIDRQKNNKIMPNSKHIPMSHHSLISFWFQINFWATLMEQIQEILHQFIRLKVWIYMYNKQIGILSFLISLACMTLQKTKHKTCFWVSEILRVHDLHVHTFVYVMQYTLLCGQMVFYLHVATANRNLKSCVSMIKLPVF